MASVNATALDALQKPGKPTTNPKGQLKVEDFIKMMVTQLQQQDPTKPADNGQLLSQMSQIGQLQSQQALQTSLTTLTLQNNIGSASNLIGKDVEGIDKESGESIAGKVQSVRVEKGSVLLRLADGTDLPMSQISSITQPNADITGAVANSANAVGAAG